MKSYLESQITWNLQHKDSESRTLFYFVMDPSGKTVFSNTFHYHCNGKDNIKNCQCICACDFKLNNQL